MRGTLRRKTRFRCAVSLYLTCYEVKLGYTARQSFLSDRIIVFARRWSVRCLQPSGTVTHCLRWASPARYGLARRPGAGARRGVEEEHFIATPVSSWPVGASQTGWRLPQLNCPFAYLPLVYLVEEEMKKYRQ